MPDIDLPTVIFALVALFVVFKLRSVLGMRGGPDRPPGLIAPLRRAPSPNPAPASPETAAPAQPAAIPSGDRWKGLAEADAWEGLDAIANADRSFAAQPFLAGARAAYEMVVQAFAAGDSVTLQNLMSPEAYGNFASAIRARADSGQTMTTTVVSIDDAKIVAAKLVGANAQVGVRFNAKLVSATRDREGEVVEGSPTTVADHVDLWTFVRDVRSSDPNWRLVETQSEA